MEFEVNIDLMNLYKGWENIKDIWLKKLKRLLKNKLLFYIIFSCEYIVFKNFKFIYLYKWMYGMFLNLNRKEICFIKLIYNVF